MQRLLEARRLVAVALDCPLEGIEESAAIGRIPGWDSIGHMSIVLALEARIGRMLRPDEMGRLKSVAEIADILSATV